MIRMPRSLIEDLDLEGIVCDFPGDLESNSVTRTRRRADGSERKEVNYYVG